MKIFFSKIIKSEKKCKKILKKIAEIIRSQFWGLFFGYD